MFKALPGGYTRFEDSPSVTRESLRTPAVFFGHGSPMNTLKSNRHTMAWEQFGQCVPRPRGILCVSAR
jgi:4,5-DOPA dioxygenase extradiol